MLKRYISVLAAFVFLIMSVWVVFLANGVEGSEAPDGAALFATNCSACHGQKAEGSYGPDIRGKKQGDIRGAINGFSAMSGIELTDDELSAIEKHLASLK